MTAVAAATAYFLNFIPLPFNFVEANAADMATLSMAIGPPNVARQIAVDVCMAGGRNFPMTKVTTTWKQWEIDIWL
ncbi:hypothetical protein [Variovorax sp. 38R]|uniref:hypothetical protein n=1 Tax=Variovorax sp. 38R TaxID=2774875 RepID=UPI001781C1FB|nr:hypothetical protein [Variovorax sp. 38R]QOF76463.1 hypothetical protein IG196_19015 [Variovorax sp. 38R]